MFLFSPVGGGFFNTMIVIISMNGLFKICLISRKPYNTASVVCPGMVSCTPAFFTYLRYIQKISKAIVNCHLFPFSISSFHHFISINFHHFPSTLANFCQSKACDAMIFHPALRVQRVPFRQEVHSKPLGPWKQVIPEIATFISVLW